MGDFVEVSKEVFEPIRELVKIGLFKDEKAALEEIVLEQARCKITLYETKIEQMKDRYGTDFEIFRKSLESRKGEEVFEEWDDLILWESYETARKFWAEAEDRIKGSS